MGSLRDSSDGALAVAIGRWREDALAEAFRRHAGAVYGLAQRVLGDRAAAEEVVQEVFLRLWNAPDRYDPERGSMRAFLLAQAHGRAVDQLRSDSSRRRRHPRAAQTGPEAADLAVLAVHLPAEGADHHHDRCGRDEQRPRPPAA